MTETVVREKYRRLTGLLIRERLQITTMESCTSGQIASLITDTEGSSAVLKGAYITYSNEAKIRCGVPREIIDTFGVYSAETAAAMATACRDAYGAEIGIGVTGTMGNVDPVNEDSVPGVVYLAMNIRGTIHGMTMTIPPLDSRYAYKLTVAEAAADRLINWINREEMKDEEQNGRDHRPS